MNLLALLGYARPYRRSLAICIVLMLLDTAAALCVPWLGGKFASDVVSQAPARMNTILLALLALFAFQALVAFANGYLLSRTTQRILADLRIRIYDHLQSLPLSFYHERRQGDILALMTHEIEVLGGFITGTLLRLVP